MSILTKDYKEIVIDFITTVNEKFDKISLQDAKDYIIQLDKAAAHIKQSDPNNEELQKQIQSCKNTLTNLVTLKTNPMPSTPKTNPEKTYDEKVSKKYEDIVNDFITMVNNKFDKISVKEAKDYIIQLDKAAAHIKQSDPNNKELQKQIQSWKNTLTNLVTLKTNRMPSTPKTIPEKTYNEKVSAYAEQFKKERSWYTAQETIKKEMKGKDQIEIQKIIFDVFKKIRHFVRPNNKSNVSHRKPRPR